MLNTLLLIGGLALILAGANGLTDGSAAVAKRFRISDLVIGLTIVAFGTSAPELVISVLSALNGSAEMAIGNVVGSNIFNALMIIGCTALVLPIKVGEGTMSKEIPLVILSSLVLFVCANDMMLDREAVNVISRSDGFVLLAFFLIFMRYTFAIARNGADEAGEEQKIKEMPVWKSVLYIAGGLAGLIFGGQLFVDGASGLARSWGVSESVIGLTLVAGGTSLPELATSVTAALKKNPGIAIGNVIGSNLFNIFFVLGCSATVSPLPMGNINNLDLSVLIASSLLLWLVVLLLLMRLDSFFFTDLFFSDMPTIFSLASTMVFNILDAASNAPGR
jgi:cation:H+ antiporter